MWLCIGCNIRRMGCVLLQGVQPAGLQSVQNQELREFIELCIQQDAERRPEARQLLKSPFFESIRTGRLRCAAQVCPGGL